MFKRLKHFDAYPKTLEDFRVKTLGGAFITLFCTILIVFLFALEWKAYTTIEIDQELFVDLTRNQKLTININMTLHKLPCGLVSVDAGDASGESSHDVSKGLKKVAVDIHNQKVKVTTPKTTDPTTTTAARNDTCLSCYGAENKELGIKCCNTCASVRTAYTAKKWQFVPQTISQCIKEYEQNNVQVKIKSKVDVEKLLESGEGCRLEGFLTVNKIAGNIHVAPGITFEDNHMHYHNMANMPVEKLNTDHYFDTFSFGDDYPNQFNPLEVKSLKTTNMPAPDQDVPDPNSQENVLQQMFQFGFGGQPGDNNAQNNSSVNYRYFLKIVPTTYEYLDGRVVNNTYQYSVTRSAKVLTQSIFGNTQIPGVFVTYELSPIMIKYVERSKPFSHFITSCCAIIGGLFTIAGMLDAFTFRYYSMYRKYQMNKLT